MARRDRSPKPKLRPVDKEKVQYGLAEVEARADFDPAMHWNPLARLGFEGFSTDKTGSGEGDIAQPAFYAPSSMSKKEAIEQSYGAHVPYEKALTVNPDDIFVDPDLANRRVWSHEMTHRGIQRIIDDINNHPEGVQQGIKDFKSRYGNDTFNLLTARTAKSHEGITEMFDDLADSAFRGTPEEEYLDDSTVEEIKRFQKTAKRKPEDRWQINKDAYKPYIKLMEAAQDILTAQGEPPQSEKPEESLLDKIKIRLGFNEGGMVETYGFGQQMEDLGIPQTPVEEEGTLEEALSRRPGFRSLEEARGQVSQEEIMAGIDNAASFLVPFYDAGVNVYNVLEEYEKPEEERDQEYINSELMKAGESAAFEAAAMLAGLGALKLGGKAIKSIKNKIKDYEIDPNSMSAFGVGAIKKKSEEMISVFPKPERMFPEDARPKGGDYLNPATGDVLSGRNVSKASLKISPDGKPSFKVSNDDVESVGSTGKGKTQIKTNLFKKKAGWKWTNAPEGMEDISTLISVENKGKHFYTVETDFSKGVNLKKYPNSKTEPRLRPTVIGEIELGPQIGTISVRGKEHPVYQNVRTFNEGGLAVEDQMQGMFKSVRNKPSVDPVSGNDIPVGSTAKEVRDDVPAMLSEGEYVVPADVVKYFGVKHFEDIRNKAKQGLQKMNQDGRIGGQPAPSEPVKAAEGTLVNTPTRTTGTSVPIGGGNQVSQVKIPTRVRPQDPTQQAQAPARSAGGMQRMTYFHPQTGEKIEVLLLNGQPISKIPPNFTEFVEDTPQNRELYPTVPTTGEAATPATEGATEAPTASSGDDTPPPGLGGTEPTRAKETSAELIKQSGINFDDPVQGAKDATDPLLSRENVGMLAKGIGLFNPALGLAARAASGLTQVDSLGKAYMNLEYAKFLGDEAAVAEIQDIIDDYDVGKLAKKLVDPEETPQNFRDMMKEVIASPSEYLFSSDRFGSQEAVDNAIKTYGIGVINVLSDKEKVYNNLDEETKAQADIIDENIVMSQVGTKGTGTGSLVTGGVTKNEDDDFVGPDGKRYSSYAAYVAADTAAKAKEAQKSTGFQAIMDADVGLDKSKQERDTSSSQTSTSGGSTFGDSLRETGQAIKEDFGALKDWATSWFDEGGLVVDKKQKGLMSKK